MYTIVNTSGRHLSLKDLRIMLSPRERLDLDSVCERRDIESSVYLKEALKKGYIKVVVKDNNAFSYTNSGMIDTVTKDDLEKIKLDLAEVIKSSLKDVKKSNSENVKVDLTDIKTEIVEVIREVINNSNLSRSNDSEKQAFDFEDLLSDQVLSEIHKKAVNRMMETAEGKVKHDDQKSVKMDLSKKVDELEGLL
jgi:hypothetical protein